MMTTTATRILEFDAAHRVMGHESKCATLHGHRYKIEVTAEAASLDNLGRVIDFSVLKEKIGGWVDEHWDHTTIVFKDDLETIDGLGHIPSRKPYFLADWNPTAENMAFFLLSEVCPKVLENSGVRVRKVRVWETPNCYSDAEY
jgi:6-pyruvoyltetrahydropterin/6-carboxytetrahydropterin synthase